MKLTDAQRAKVEDLLSRMTLEEKLGQLNQESPSIVGGFDVPFPELIEMVTEGRLSQEEFQKIMDTAQRDYHEEDIRAGRVGSMMGNDPVKANELQHIAVEESRLGIPLIIGFDVIHGLRSVYPIAIAEAGSFDDDLMERTARMAARESRAYGIGWNFAPMLDVARDARWGRVSEGPGEDTRLAERFARAKVRGLQNDRSGPDSYVAACLKHFVGYGACEGGRDYNTVSMAPSQLHSVYLPPFRAAVEEGAATVMAAFNDLNGVPCTLNPYTLRTLLKGDWAFPGFVVSDANAIRECVVHGIAADEAEAGAMALRAGLDMDMGTHIYRDELAAALSAGRISQTEIDDAVRRILSVKVWLGLFAHPYVEEPVIRSYAAGLPEAHRALCREAAEKSLVLLKNAGGLLPLQKERRISLVGALAASDTEVVGAWALGWEKRDCVSILQGLKNAGADVGYYPCGGPEGALDTAEVERACADGDVIVAVVGETAAMSGEASSRAHITLPGRQRELLALLSASGKPVIAVLMNGRPLALGWESEHLDAIVEAWHLGIGMGDAVAAALFGEINPSGRLSSSFPWDDGQEPTYYNHPSTGRPAGKSKFTSKYLDVPAEALYPFGYGLSYTAFAYDGLTVTEREDALEIAVTVRNSGERPGTETVQLYTRDVTASLVRPVKELKDYRRVTLRAGASETVTFRLPKADLGFWNNEGVYVREDGLFQICAGGNSRDTLTEEITVRF